jgi:hypothetical protein
LTTTNLNVSNGGSRTAGKKMRATTFNNIPQSMQLPDGITLKGLQLILQERGVNTDGLRKPEMVEILNGHPDFQNQKPWLEEICSNANHKIIFFPKFHPEFNWIEPYWSIAKDYARKQCDYTFNTLKTTVPAALDRIEVQTMRRFARKCYRYMNAYRLSNGQNETLSLKQVEWTVKKYHSHRRIPDTFDNIVQLYTTETL